VREVWQYTLFTFTDTHVHFDVILVPEIHAPLTSIIREYFFQYLGYLCNYCQIDINC